MQIKGIREGLLFIADEGEWGEVHDSIRKKVELQQEFLRGAQVALDVGDHELEKNDLEELSTTLSEHAINLWAVLSRSAKTTEAAQALNLVTRICMSEDKDDEALETTLYGGEEAVLINKTLRSGFRVQYPGHVIVIGDVNPGAEIVAGGNILVWGKLRGLVHAGAEGDETAIVCALDLRPMQLRIASQIALAPKQAETANPEVARIKDGLVVAEPWINR